MNTYARIQAGAVFELFECDGPITGLFDPKLVWIDVTAVAPQPQQGWTYDGTAFAAPVIPSLTLAQEASAALATGLTITLSGTVALAAAVFPTDQTTTGKIGQVVLALGATGAFPGGAETYPLKDASGTWHTFTAAQYKAVATAIAAYVAPLDLIIDGNPLGVTELPPSSVTLTV